RRLLDGQRVTYAGEVFVVHDVALDAPPPAPVPILLGVKGPRALALAAEVADGVHCSVLASPAHVRRVRAATSSRARAGFRVIAYVLVAVSDDRAQARAWVRPLIARYLGVLPGQPIHAHAGLDPPPPHLVRDAPLARPPAAGLVTGAQVPAS